MADVVNRMIGLYRGKARAKRAAVFLKHFEITADTRILDLGSEDGSNIDTTSNILTLLNGTQIDITTGQEVVDLSSIANFANGAYLDTKKNIMTLADGTKIDTVTGLHITT